MTKKYLLTKEGLEKLKKELDVLINERRREVIERIQEAVAHGDLSENADYAQAKEEQAFIEGRIQELEETIKNAELINTNGSRSTVAVGSKVKLKLESTVVRDNQCSVWRHRDVSLYPAVSVVPNPCFQCQRVCY